MNEPQALLKTGAADRPGPLTGLEELSADALVREVLARNPSVTQMLAAWQAATARYPQVTSLDDPMLGAYAAPGAFGSDSVNGGYRLELSQKFLYPGKLALRGQSAAADASAAGNEVADVRLQLAESARSAFYDYYAAARALEVNRESQKLLRQFRDDAKTRVVTGQVPQYDLLQADLEIAQQREREATLDRMREVAVARINTLLHLPPDSPLPPPPKELFVADEVPDAAALRQQALSRRPDLKALADRVAAEQAAVALAEREYKPDFDVMASYDTFWQEKPLRAQVGVRMNLPVRMNRRDAAVVEARARLAQRQAELARLADQVGLQVHEAASQVRESQRVVRLYEADLLPTARQAVKAFRAEFVTGKVPLWRLVNSQRDLVGIEDRYYEAVAAAGRRLATLKRVVGAAAVETPEAGSPSVPEAVPHLPPPRSGLPTDGHAPTTGAATPQVLPTVVIRPR